MQPGDNRKSNSIGSLTGEKDTNRDSPAVVEAIQAEEKAMVVVKGIEMGAAAEKVKAVEALMVDPLRYLIQ